MYKTTFLILLILLFLCSFTKNENFYSNLKFSKCSKCREKIIPNGLCFDKKNECEKICSAIYDKVGIQEKVIHKCKGDLDGTYICSTPEWLDKYSR
jgi:hypothetical protein